MTSHSTPPSRPLQDLLARLPVDGELDFFRLLEALDAVRFTGPLTIDFLNGIPRQIHLGQPIRLTICSGGLDKGESSRTG